MPHITAPSLSATQQHSQADTLSLGRGPVITSQSTATNPDHLHYYEVRFICIFSIMVIRIKHGKRLHPPNSYLITCRPTLPKKATECHLLQMTPIHSPHRNFTFFSCCHLLVWYSGSECPFAPAAMTDDAHGFYMSLNFL